MPNGAKGQELFNPSGKLGFLHRGQERRKGREGGKAVKNQDLRQRFDGRGFGLVITGLEVRRIRDTLIAPNSKLGRITGY